MKKNTATEASVLPCGRHSDALTDSGEAEKKKPLANEDAALQKKQLPCANKKVNKQVKSKQTNK
jgi:hypothetical protein